VPITNCPVCGSPVPATDADATEKYGAVAQIACPDCGTYYAVGPIMRRPLYKSEMPETDYRHVSAWIRDQWRRGVDHILVSEQDAAAALKNVSRLAPAEKAQRLLLVLARISKQPGDLIQYSAISRADSWATTAGEAKTYYGWLREQGYLRSDEKHFLLTMPGWAEAERLQNLKAASGNLAFMAMQFGDERLDALVANHYQPAVKAAGFELRRVDQGQPAGLIDDQLRVRIRTARFVVSDITHGNNGTYWEAGFGEGLGRPVIYSCERSVFDSLEKNKRVHFDTNHLVTVLWEPDKPEEAAGKLKNIVRATFPGEASLED
jgi:hypothetical protein